MILLYDNNIATVFLSLFLSVGSCSQLLGGTILFLDNNIATVYSSLFYNSGLWFHSLEGIILFSAKNIANVILYKLSLNSGDINLSYFI